MLGTTDAIATIAVKDMEVARRFYEGTLDLRRTGAEEPGAITYQAGSSAVLVYESEHAGTNQATVVTWLVGEDLAEVVRTLKGRGVALERYELPGTTREGDVHVAGETKVAWFKDPDGNIHSLVNA